MTDTNRIDAILAALFPQIWMGKTHLLIWEQLSKLLTENPELVKLSGVFFQFTLRAHIDSSLLHLARLLDRHKDAVSLPYLLRVACSRSADFPHRNKDGVLRAVREDEARLEDLRETIEALAVRRDKQIAHLDKANIKDASQLASDGSLTLAEVKELYYEVWNIVCRYSAYRSESSVHDELMGWEDFQDLVRVAKKGIEIEKAELERLIGQPGKEGH